MTHLRQRTRKPDVLISSGRACVVAVTQLDAKPSNECAEAPDVILMDIRMPDLDAL
jgi:CheY-like chemotaxis protein